MEDNKNNKLKEASKEYVKRELEKHNFINFHGADSVEKAFINGGKWQLSNMWVSITKELPKNSENVIIMSKDGYVSVGSYDSTYKTWIEIPTGNSYPISWVAYWMVRPKLSIKKK